METSSTNQTNQDQAMSSVGVMSEVTRGIARREKHRMGDAAAAQRSTARRLRIGGGTLKNLIYRRVKAVSAELRDRIVAAAIADLTSEIRRLEHEKQLLLAMGTRPDHDDYCALESALATAHEVIDRMRGSA